MQHAALWRPLTTITTIEGVCLHTYERQHHGRGDVADKYDGQTGDDRQRNGPLGVVGFLARRRDYVEPDERVETRRRPREHLQQQ